jgi:methionyl-tRNA formyltransferase
MRVLFLGTPEFAEEALKRMILDNHFEIVGVVTQPDRPAGRKMQLTASPVKKLALENGLPTFTPTSVNTPEFLQTLSELRAESAAVVAFGQILSQKFLDLFPLGCVNVHGSLLPRWRGAAPIQRAIMAGDTESGVSLQKIVKKLDAGDVFGVRRVQIPESMNAVELYSTLKVLGADLLAIEYMDYLRGNLTAHPQDESQVTFAAKIDKSEALIRWERPAREIFNQIRGMAMGPIPWTSREGKTLKIHTTRVAAEGGAGAGKKPGTVLSVSPTGLTVACGEGSLEILEVQPESRAKQSIAEYLRGYPLQVGDVLGS